MQWISVKDRLPNDGDPVLVSCEHGVCEAWLYDGMWENSEGYLGRSAGVSHWMPLPKPPKEE